MFLRLRFDPQWHIFLNIFSKYQYHFLPKPPKIVFPVQHAVCHLKLKLWFYIYLGIHILKDEYWVNWRNNVMTTNVNENINFTLERISPHCLPWPSIKNNFESSRAKSEFHMRKMSIFQGHKKNDAKFPKKEYMYDVYSLICI